MNEVLSFREAINAGYDPMYYKYGKDLPVGTHEVQLEFKIWAKGSTPAITCFCKIVSTGELIRFNVFRDRETGYLYHLPQTVIDIRLMDYGTIFQINIVLNKRGNTAVTG